MKAQYLNTLSASFCLFVDHELLRVGESHSLVPSGRLYYKNDPNFYGWTIYQSPFRQWVSDSSIPNASISSGVSFGGNFISKGASGLKIDYSMGRVFFSGVVPTGISSLTCGFSVKDFNVFYTSKADTDLLFERSWKQTPKIGGRVTGALEPYDEPYPLVYIKHRIGENSPFAFGGMDASKNEYRCILLSDSPSRLDAAVSILQDSAHKSFPLIPATGLPFNIFGDFKSGIGGFNYSSLSSLYKNNLIYIKKVRVSKFDERINKAIKGDMWGAFVDFELEDHRHPHV